MTYHAGLEDLARRAAASAERARAALSVLLADAPAGTIDIVVTDNLDLSNGYASPFPTNRIVVYARPPVDVLELQYMHDWIDLVVTHELAHVFHLDVSGRVGRALRSVFGRVLAPWPFFPAVLTPAWSIEGLAVGIESALSGLGRVHGSYHEMVVRTAALEDRIDDIDRLGSASPVWPGPARVYIYGGLFMDYIARRFGPEAAARMVRSTGGAVIPPPLWFDRVGADALGVTFRQAYRDWQAELDERYAAQAASLRDRGITASVSLTRHGATALHPRYSPDGLSIAYAGDDGRAVPATRIIDAETGREVRRVRRNTTATVAWMPDGRLLTSDLEFTDRFRAFSDLVILEGGDRRLTRGARLHDPDVSRDGDRVVAVESREGTNRLVLLQPDGGGARPVTAFDPDVHWALPRFSPGGEFIAAGRWRTGGAYDVVVLDTLGVLRGEVTRGPGISAAPAWSPDGRWLLFWSDRTGIPNLYAADMDALRVEAVTGQRDDVAAGPPLRQVTNVLTGAFFPDVSPDGRWIAFSAYHHDGFHIERVPFDAGAWREPAPAEFGGMADARGGHIADAPAGHLDAAIAAAAARADTVAGEPRAYRAARHARPHAWMPLLQSGAGGGRSTLFYGVMLTGWDLVERHAWDLTIAVEPRSGRSQGRFSYTFRGLPTLPALGLHPSVTLAAARYWDVIASSTAQQRFIDEREDQVALGVGLVRPRFRTSLGGSLGVELVHSSRELHGTGWPEGARLRNPDDDLFGVRGSAFLATFSMPRFAISRENGVFLQVAGRRRYDRNPEDVIIEDQPVRLDAGYREFTTWDAAYLALPLPGFARHVLAARMSGLVRDGPGASTSSIGGVASQGLALPGLGQAVGGSSRLLPVRGFDSGARRGSRAWTASGEYRFPVTLVSRSLHPLPVFFDRLAGTAFLDAGHAWCDPDTAARLVPGACTTTDSAMAPLLAAGGEIVAIVSVWGANTPVRLGLAAPIQGGADRSPRAYLMAGAAF
ncbi:MAG TPA: hypothetical protein VK936_09605 [Longimicrobiales bacterium]|nr:hypothetical protein [Longimicrobiales bacterium]